MMKLYTRSGDDGSTGLFGGGRVAKDNPRVEAYGTVDELNASLGLVACQIDGSAEAFHLEVRDLLRQIQSRLFDLGADLATPEGDRHENKISRITPEQVAELEQAIDRIDTGNTPMTHFVLPGGTELAARLHLARTICRRAERCIVKLTEHESINQVTVVYLNRLSDLLFALARRANHEAGVDDVEWIPHEPS